MDGERTSRGFDLTQCNRERGLHWSKLWSKYRIVVNGVRPFYGVFNVVDGIFSCFDKGFTAYVFEIACPSDESKIMDSGELNYREMAILNPRDCSRLTTDLATGLKGNFFSNVIRRTIKTEGKKDLELCYRVSADNEGFFEKECPIEEMREAVIPVKNFYFAKIDSEGNRDKFFLSPTWDQYEELKRVKHLILEKDYYEYDSHEYTDKEYTELDILEL